MEKLDATHFAFVQGVVKLRVRTEGGMAFVLFRKTPRMTPIVAAFDTAARQLDIRCFQVDLFDQKNARLYQNLMGSSTRPVADYLYVIYRQGTPDGIISAPLQTTREILTRFNTYLQKAEERRMNETGRPMQMRTAAPPQMNPRARGNRRDVEIEDRRFDEPAEVIPYNKPWELSAD